MKLRFDNPKLFALTLIIAVLAGSYFSYAMTNSVVIDNHVTLSLSIVTAKSGSPADIQSAVNIVAAAGGGTVNVPAGNFTWTTAITVTIPAGVNVNGSGWAGCSGHTTNWTNYAATTILHSTVDPLSMVPMFEVDGSRYAATPPTRISGIQFEAKAPTSYTDEPSPQNGIGDSTGIHLRWCYNYRVDHCTFIDFSSDAIYCDANSGDNATSCCYGVIDHCVVSDLYKLNNPGASGWEWGYGFYATGYNYLLASWNNNPVDFRGVYGSVASASLMYVEDCHFSYCRHCLDTMNGGYYVARYCLFDNPACKYTIFLCDSHGTNVGGWGLGGQGNEVYNCTFYALPTGTSYTWLATSNIAWAIRGGFGIFTNNTFYGNGNSGTYMVYLDETEENPNRAAGAINYTYVWNNTYSNANYLKVTANCTQDVNYFLRAPSLTLDGFTYTPYTYPIATG